LQIKINITFKNKAEILTRSLQITLKKSKYIAASMMLKNSMLSDLQQQIISQNPAMLI
jgi:hypothetical protein